MTNIVVLISFYVGCGERTNGPVILRVSDRAYCRLSKSFTGVRYSELAIVEEKVTLSFSLSLFFFSCICLYYYLHTPFPASLVERHSHSPSFSSFSFFPLSLSLSLLSPSIYISLISPFSLCISPSPSSLTHILSLSQTLSLSSSDYPPSFSPSTPLVSLSLTLYLFSPLSLSIPLLTSLSHTSVSLSFLSLWTLFLFLLFLYVSCLSHSLYVSQVVCFIHKSECFHYTESLCVYISLYISVYLLSSLPLYFILSWVWNVWYRYVFIVTGIMVNSDGYRRTKCHCCWALCRSGGKDHRMRHRNSYWSQHAWMFQIRNQRLP